MRTASNGSALHGERLEVLETRRKFVKVRTSSGAEGWTDAALLLTQKQMDALTQLAARVAASPSQGAGTVFDTLNVHTAPSRTSTSFAQIDEGQALDVVARRVTRHELPGGEVSADDWFLVRTNAGQAGWVLARMVLMGIPDEIAQFAQRHYIMSYLQFGESRDPVSGAVKPNWLWTTAEQAHQPFDFDTIQVFVYDFRREGYVPAFTERGLRGHYPLEGRGSEFSVVVEEPDGVWSKRYYTFTGTRAKLQSKTVYAQPGALPEVSGAQSFDRRTPERDDWASRVRAYGRWWLGL